MTFEINKNLSLSKLYKTPSINELVWNCLCPVFDDKFDYLMEKGLNVGSNLIKLAKSKKHWIKRLFIEYGHPLDTLEDLKNCLDIEDKESPCETKTDFDSDLEMAEYEHEKNCNLCFK